jgi:MFS family permease
MNLDSNQAEDQVGGVDRRSLRARRREIPSSSGKKTTAAAFWTFFSLAFLSIAISLPLWFVTNSAPASITVCICIAVVSAWYVGYNARIYGGLTFSSCFVAVSAFVFVARGVYVSLYNDFGILTSLAQPPFHHLITDALIYVLFGTLAFIWGALLLERKTVAEFEKSHARPRMTLSLAVPNLSLVFLGIQLAFVFVLLPYGTAQDRESLANASVNAYIYLLPTLIHGFNLYFFAYMVAGWSRKPGTTKLLMLMGSLMLMVLNAYCMYNMSNFRGFYLIGLFTGSLVFMLARFGKVPVLILVVIFAAYPLFKNMGSDRTLSNKEMVESVLLSPGASYNKGGMERAFGEATDINMLDTLVASLNYEHKWHPYILSDLYVFVHWIPRSLWPSKPLYGILDDLSYTQGLPYSPGLIGFFNDDGGKLYMVVAMGFLGALFKWCEMLTLRIRWRELFLCVWAAFFLTALVTVRYLPYQVFYGFMVFFVPALLLNWVVRFATGQPERSGGTGQRNGNRRSKTVVL